jgi:RHS repeat-associated protein
VPVEISSSYRYNINGIRVGKTSDITNLDTNQLFDNSKTYLTDPQNPTGYAQVFEEYDATGLTKSYTIGDDVISQSSSPSQFLLYDGHGSTRMLTGTSGAVSDRFDYDAYGVNQFSDGPLTDPSTSLLYSGEQYDSGLGMQYLRARYYDQNAGVFNRVDPYGGLKYDPQSLHKYLYCHNSPVDAIDPSGEFSIVGLLSAVALKTNMRTLKIGASTGAVSNGIFSFAFKLFKSLLFNDPFFTVENMIDIAEDTALGAVTGAFGAVVGNGVTVFKEMRAFLGLAKYGFFQKVLRYALVPGFIKSVFGTTLAYYKDLVAGNRWGFDKLWKTFVFSFFFASVFELPSMGVLSMQSSQAQKMKGLVSEWNRRFRIWQGGRDRQGFIDQMNAVAKQMKLQYLIEDAYVMLSGPIGSVIFSITESFAKSISPVQPPK